MMATYSGNLIAFLTVTKDKLPFTDLSGLVAQDKYEWGTQGGSVFEHIFKVKLKLCVNFILYQIVNKSIR